MRLIEADKAKEVLKHQLYETAMNSIKSMVDVSPYKQIGIDMSPIYEDIAKNRIDIWVNLVPTVDAEPIRHGHWVDDGERYGLDHGLAMWECDQCGETIWAYLKDPRRWNYCPQCGSKMSEEVLIKLKRAKMDEVTE